MTIKKLMNKINKKIDKLTKELDEISNIVKMFQQQQSQHEQYQNEICIFWDIENCAIPKEKSGYELVSIIQDYVSTIYPESKIIIKCYFEDKQLGDKQQIELNDAGCHLHLVPNPYKKKERSDMVIVRDMMNINENHIIGLISNDGDFKPYLTQLQTKVKEVFLMTDNKKYSDFMPNVISWKEICLELE